MCDSFIDLFCGVGGIRLGMESAGFSCLMSSDINIDCQKTYLENFKELPEGDITKISEESIPSHDVLCAGFPCQPFSISGLQEGFKDTRGTLFYHICRIINEKRPSVVFLENVKHLVYHDHGNTLSVILGQLEKFGYKVAWRVLNSLDFGVPQNRERIIIIASYKGLFDFGKIKTVPRRPLIDFLDKEGDFEYLNPSEYTLIDNPKEQPDSGLIFAGYRNKTIRKVGVREGTINLSRVHKQPNRIYSVLGSHPTLPSQEISGRFFIMTKEKKVRKLKLDECWRIMGFPDSYIKVSSAAEQYRQLGNSVCVPMISAIAKEIKNQFFKEDIDMTHKEILEKIYNEVLANPDSILSIPDKIKEDVRLIATHSESNKGIIAVLTTLLVHKIVNSTQDIRYHQAQLENGFSGRSIDTNEVTPFLKSVSFPSMSATGWLTRSLEQPHPYTLDYPGKIKPTLIKKAFLEIINEVQVEGLNAKSVLSILFDSLIKQRDSLRIDLAKPHSLSIMDIIKLLEKHFNYRYTCSGASRLPVLAIYAVYQCMISQVERYKGKVLCPLESHTSADSQSGRIGDIDVDNADKTAFEGVEIKHEIPITEQLITDSYEKFKAYKTDRYYLLTTANMDSADWDSINNEIKRIRMIHGCQVIVNGVYSSLKYYLRLLNDSAEFIDNYVELLKTDETIKFQHKAAWNELVSSGV